MPIYTPSYFPPASQNGSIVGATAGLNSQGARRFLAGLAAGNNSTIDDLIVVGHQSFDAGSSDPDLAGTIVIGNNALSAVVTNAGNIQKPSLVIGTAAAAVLQSSDANVIIGNGALTSYAGGTNFVGTPRGNVFLGPDVCGNMSPDNGAGSDGVTFDSVFIGRRASFCSASPRFSVQRSVVIGAQANEDAGGGPGASMDNNVIIGYRAGSSIGFANQTGIDNVLIGSNCAGGVANIREAVIIGSGAAATSGPAPGNEQARGIVALGTGTVSRGGRNTLLGAAIDVSGNGNIIVGRNGSTNAPNPLNDTLIIGTDQGRFAYAALITGNVILGNSNAGGTLLDFGTGGPTNVVKLINGSKASSNPVGGGYFYVAAGALHWVGSAGTDTVVAPA